MQQISDACALKKRRARLCRTLCAKSNSEKRARAIPVRIEMLR